MRLTLPAATLALPLLLQPVLADAQTTTPAISNPTAGPSSTPAPVPSIMPGTPQTGAASIPPERIAPPGTGTADSTDTSLPNASPLSGAPGSLNPGTNQATPRGGGSAHPLTPNLSR